MKKLLFIMFILIILCLGLYSGYNTILNNSKKEKEGRLVDNIKSHFNTYVKTNKEADIYEYDESKKEYSKAGNISNNIELTLIDNNITYEATYFKIKNLNYYIYYEDVTPIDNLDKIDNRYKSYVIFNENISTKQITNFYDSNDKLVFKINTTFNLPIIIKDTNKYGVEYNDQLLYIHKDDILNTYENNNTDDSVRTNIRTFTYHTVYDKKTQVCNSIEICHTIEQFTSHMKYLSENNYLTLTMEELEMFLDNKIRIPIKTVTITLDDGIHMENSVPIVEEYKVHATFFVITGSHDASPYLNSEYARFESHTNNLHNNYKCSGGNQGSQMLCEDYDDMVADLKVSQQKLNDSYYFAYPFFDYNDRVIKALKEAGFKMAFVGQLSYEGYSDSKTNRYLLRRETIFGNLSFDEFIDSLPHD